jgi:hypothetical protein
VQVQAQSSTPVRQFLLFFHPLFELYRLSEVLLWGILRWQAQAEEQAEAQVEATEVLLLWACAVFSGTEFAV